MFTLTSEVLRKTMPNLSAARAQEFAPELTQGMSKWGIDTWDEITMFLANLAHESGEFRWMEEIWGPTTQQLKYERNFSAPWQEGLRPGDPNYVAFNLGNANKGDGRRYSGHGPIQVTGATNHLLMGFILEQDFLANPLLLTTTHWGVQAACVYWWNNRLDDKAKKSFVAVVKGINGGTIGLADREKYLNLARAAIPKF
ncbi:hypothetical protein D3C87_1198530 [compost metagenome]